jgi:Protein kinase domain
VTEQIPGMPGDLVAGARIAGYRLEERIGQGGMAVVFRAYDHRLDRMVALKVLAPALAEDEAFRQRFIRESRAAAAVDDPHIIPVFEAGEADGFLFIAMRFVRGGDVRSLVDRIGPLPGGRAAEIISQTASALDAAHAIGLVHRDVKPANMLLDGRPSADRPDHVYLSDFGLSKASLAMSGLTAAGQFLGTLEYVAPEQIEGRPVDARTDLYALACAAFELLSGEPPFRREDPRALMYAQLHEPPPGLRRQRPDLPPGADDVMARALAKAPADRYPSCREFAAALAARLGPAPGRPRHPATEVAGPPRAARPAPRPPARQPPPAPATAGRPQADFPPADYLYRGQSPTARRGPEGAGAEPPGGGERRTQPPPARRTEPVGGPGPNSPAARRGTGPAGGPGPNSPAARRTEPVSAEPADEAGRRPWWRSPLPVAGVCAVVLLAGGAYALAGRGSGHTPAVALPGCTTALAKAPTLTGVRSAAVATSNGPFGVTADGQYSFVDGGSTIDVYRAAGALAPALVRSITAGQGDKGATLTPDGKFLVVAGNSGAVVVSVAGAEQGAADPVEGSLTSPGGKGAVQVLVSPDGNFAFVTLQSSAEMAVFNLKRGLRHGFSPADFVGYVTLGNQPVGIAGDGTWLYVANIGGTISVVSMRTAETSPASAVVATAQGGCAPDRTLLSANGQVLWVTARGSDALLGFSTARLRTDPLHALIARVMVGAVPLGLVFAHGGTMIVVGDSNLSGRKDATANLAVVSTARALAGQPALLGYIPTGLLPRELAAGPGTVLVTDQNSAQLQAVRTADLP